MHEDERGSGAAGSRFREDSPRCLLEPATGTALGRHSREGGYRNPYDLIMYDSVRGGDLDRTDLRVTTPLFKGMTEASGGIWSPAAGVGMFADIAGNPTYQRLDARVECQTAMDVQPWMSCPSSWALFSDTLG